MKPIFIKLTDSDTSETLYINFANVTSFAAIPDKGTSLHCLEGYESVKETPEQIEAALKAAAIQVIECGASEGEKVEVQPTEEPKKWFRVIANTTFHGFKLGEKVYHKVDARYSNSKDWWILDGDTDVEPWTDEPTLTN